MHLDYCKEVKEMLQERIDKQAESIYDKKLFYESGKVGIKCLHHFGHLIKVYNALLEKEIKEAKLAAAEGYETIRKAREIKEGLAEDYSDMEQIKSEGKRVHEWDTGKSETHSGGTGPQRVSNMSSNKPMVRGE